MNNTLSPQTTPDLGVMVIGLGTHAQRGHIDHFKTCGIKLIAAIDTNDG